MRGNSIFKGIFVVSLEGRTNISTESIHAISSARTWCTQQCNPRSKADTQFVPKLDPLETILSWESPEKMSWDEKGKSKDVQSNQTTCLHRIWQTVPDMNAARTPNDCRHIRCHHPSGDHRRSCLDAAGSETPPAFRCERTTAVTWEHDRVKILYRTTLSGNIGTGQV